MTRDSRDMEVIKTTEEHLPALVELLQILFSQEEEFQPDPAKQEAGLRMILSDPSTGVILALVQDGRVIGMINLLFSVSTFLGAKVAVMEDVVIHPEHRSSGLGTFLLNGAIEEARIQGCKRITLLTDTVNKGARLFYKKNGFTESNMIPYRLMLDE